MLFLRNQKRKKNTPYNRSENVYFKLYYFLRGIPMKESNFQSNLIKEIKDRFEGCMVLKNDSSYIQGIPDLLILHNGNWAALECKKSANAHHQPNQDYYIQKMNEMSYAAFISPENKEEVLDAIQQSFEFERTACPSRSK